MKRGYADIPEGQVHYRTEGSGAPLLLLHQTAFSSDEYTRVIPLLSGSFRVIAMDTLGFGMSDTPPRAYKIEDYARSVKSLLDALGIRPVAVFGHHTGASIALDLAAAYPDYVSRLMMSGCPYYTPEERHERLTAPRFKPMEINAGGAYLTDAWALARPRMPVSGPPGWHRWVLAKLMAGPRGEEAHHAVFQYNETARLPLVRCPTLLMSGDKDTFLNKLDATCKLIPNCRTKVITGGGVLTVEYPEALAAAILEYLKI